MTSRSYKIEVDFARLKRVPRPTGDEPIQIELTAPGHVRITNDNVAGVICEQRQTNATSNKSSNDGNGRQEVAECRRRTSGRSTCRFEVREPSKLHIRLKLRLRAAPTQAAARGVSLGSGGRRSSRAALFGRALSAGGLTTQQKNGAEGGSDVVGLWQTKTRPTEWHVEPASACSEQVPAAGANCHTSGLSKVNRINRLIASRPAEPEELARRVFRRDLKDGCSWKRTLGKQGHQSNRQRSGDCLNLKIKERNTSWTSWKSGKLNDQYPKVVLCDVANSGVTLSQYCSYNLPNVLRTEVIRCFKKKMRAIYRFEHSCLRYNAHQNENEAAAKNGECCPSIRSERSICPSWRGTKHQRHLRECTDAQTFPRHITCSFPQELSSEGSTACSASFSAGEQLLMMAGCGADVGERGVREDFRPGFPLAQPNDDTQSSTPDLESTASLRSHCGDRRRTCFLVADESLSCAEDTLRNCTSLRLARKKECFREEINSSKVATLSEAFAQDVNEEMDELASNTCQRVQGYVRKIVFSCARTDMPWPFPNSVQNTVSHAVKPMSPAELIDPPHNSESPQNRNEPNTFTNSPNGSLSDGPQRSFLKPAPHDPRQNYEKQDGRSEQVSEKQSNANNHDHGANRELESYLIATERAQTRPASDRTHLSANVASLLPDSAPQTDSAASTPPSSVLGLNDWGSATTLSSLSSPSTGPSLSSQQKEPSSVDSAEASFASCLVQIVEIPLFHSEKSHRTHTAPFSPSQCTDSSESCESFLLLPQDTNVHRMELADTALPKSVPYRAIPTRHTKYELPECALPTSRGRDTEFTLPPMLSPVSSPHVASKAANQGCSDGEEPMHKANSKPNMCHVSDVANAKCRTSTGETQKVTAGLKPVLSLTPVLSPRDTPKDSDSDAEQRQSETSDVDTPGCKVRTAHPAGGLRERQSSSSCQGDDSNMVGSFASCSEGEMEQTNVEADAVLDEFSAFEQDILLIGVTQDDPELFANVPKESLMNLGPIRTRETTQTSSLLQRSFGAPSALAQRLSTVNINCLSHSHDNTEDSNDRPWRPQRSSRNTKTQKNALSSPESLSEITALTADINNHAREILHRTQPIRMVNLSNNHSSRGQNGPLNTIPASSTEFRPYKSSSYCRLYFSESLSCTYKVCRFQHVPAEGDEKFCIDTVRKFTKNPACLQKAGAIFTSYYHNNPPGVYFSTPVLLSLLWTQLKAGMISDVFSVLRVSAPHRIVPSWDFLLTLFRDVRERGHVNFMSELTQLTSQMVNAGLLLNLDFLDSIKNTPDIQQPFGSNCTTGMFFSAESACPDYLKLAYAIVEIELCTRQEDWRGMGDVFRSICQSNPRPNQMEHISGRMVIALLSESKDKLSLPYAAFALTAFKSTDENSLAWGLFGRIGVSLMLRYHKTHQWAKGRKVVEVLIASKINYSKLKGLFGNEDGTSRCSLLTVAAELWLLSGSVEGALKTLRENNWFVCSSAWPCGVADLENRIHLLMRLAEKTSHRDTLEVLCNLPGLKEANELIDISRFCPLFSAHLQTCVDRQVLPVASDTVDFMLSKKMAVDGGTLQMLLHKLGKQSLWLRAREVFRYSLGEDYYPGLSAPPGSMSLVVPCRLGEVELALALEMFITINASTILSFSETSDRSLMITLKRTQSVESEYLSAASRLLSASSVLLPKLLVQYKAVNSSQEQVFTVCPTSARSWLRHNHGWANEAWASAHLTMLNKHEAVGSLGEKMLQIA